MDAATQLKAQLSSFDDDQVINVRELSVLLGTTPANVYKLSCHTPSSLPPRLEGFGRRLAWRFGTCKAWVRARDGVMASPSYTEPQTRRTGRPRMA